MSVKKQHMVKIKFSGRNLADLDFFTKSDPFLILSRPSRIGDGYNQVRKTETVMNNLNPDWKVLYIPLSELCDNDFNMKLKIEVHDEDSKKKSEEIGRCDLSLQEMLNLASSGAPTHLKLKTKVRGALLVKECLVENPTDPPASNRVSQDSLFSRPGSMAGYPNSRVGSMAGYPESRVGSMAGYPGSRPGTMSGYSVDSISGYPLPASLQLQGYPDADGYSGYPINQSHESRYNSIAEYPPSQSDNGYRQSQASIGHPSSQSSGYPVSQPSGYPPSQSSGYPPSQSSGYPPSQSSGYPPSQSSGYPPSQSSGYPPSQSSGYPPSQSSGYPPSQSSGYPPSQSSGYPPSQSSGYPPSQSSGYPPSQSSGYPPSQPSGYPPSQPSGYPPSQPSSYPSSQPSNGYPPSQPSGYATQHDSRYPSSSQSFQSGSMYPSLDQITDDRHSYLKNNPSHPQLF